MSTVSPKAREATAALPTAAPAASDRAELLALSACLVLALVLRLPGLGGGLWYDEIETLVEYVRRPLTLILGTFDSKNQHLLYSIAAHLSVSVLGESAATLRLPAVLFGVASVLAYHRFARAVGGRDEALIGAAALAVSYHHVWFSQNARGYTGLLLFTLLATHVLWRMLSGAPARRLDPLWYGVWLALAVYTHFTAVLVGVAHALIVGGVALLRRARGVELGVGRAFGALVCSVVLGLLLYGPVLPQVLGTLVGPSPFAAETTWQSPLWLLAETARGLGRGLPGGWITLTVGLVVMALGLGRLWLQDRLLVWLLLLPGLLTAATVLALGHNLWPRFFFFSAGFIVLIAVRGGFEAARLLFSSRGRQVAQIGALGALIASATTVPRAWAPKQDYEAAARFVDESRAAADAVAVVDLTDYPYTRYLHRDWTILTGEAELAALERRHERTWVLYTFPIRLAAVQPGIWRRLGTAYDTAAVFPGTVGDGTIVVMVSQSTERGAP